MNPRTLRKLIAVVSVAAVTVLATATASTATPTPDSTSATAGSTTLVPTAAAKRAGITKPGQAYMGWSRGAQSPSTPGTAPITINATTEAVHGIDVSGWQENMDWQGWWDAGSRWAYVKATEGANYQNPLFGEQYGGSYNVGMVRGAYHFALPDQSWGDAQANKFVDSGGGWSADGKTFPGALDIEYNPYGATCYGLSQVDMVNWIASFTGTYRARTGRDPVIYTTANWWSQCTGDSGAFNTTNPLWVACYCGSVGTIPGGWPSQHIWQYTDAPLDQNWFSGTMADVSALAYG